MDLVDLLIDATITGRDKDLVVSLGHAALDAYYDDLQQRYMSRRVGQRMVRASLNFAVQQLATRSRMSPETERYLQIGAFDPCDLAWALLNAMPQTLVQWVPGFTALAAEPVADAVDELRALLPADAMPQDVRVTDQPWQDVVSLARPGSFGLITVFTDRNDRALVDIVASLRRMVHGNGRVVVYEALAGGRRPTPFPGPDFVGRYVMTGGNAALTLCISVLPPLSA